MLALKEFANFVTLNTASLAATYAQLLAESGEDYNAFSAHTRKASARKLLKAVAEACELESAAPLCRLFEACAESQQPPVPDQAISLSPRWTENIVPPQPLLELECLGQTLMPVVTSLEAGKFLWQILSEIRATLLNHRIVEGATSPPKVPTETSKATHQILDDQPEESGPARPDLLSRFYKTSSDATMILDQTGFVDCNEATLKLFGHTSLEAFLNTHPSEQSPPVQPDGEDSQTAANEKIATAIREGAHRFEWLHRRADGSIFPAEVLLTAIDLDGKPLLQAIVRDITDRKQVETRLAKRATELQAVAAITTAATGILDFQELLQSSVDLTKEKFDLLHAQIYLFDEAEDSLVLAAGAGEAGQRLVAEGWSISLQQEQSLVVRAARTRQGVIFNDIQDSSGWQSDSLLPEARAQMAIPMIAGDKVVGVLDVQADVTDRFTQEDIHIKTVLATQIAAALRNAELFSETEILFQASAGLNTAQTYDDILSVLRQYTVVGQGAQNVSLSYFDHPFTEQQTPEWVLVLSRWSELPSEAVTARYQIAAFPAVTEVLRPDVPILVEDVSADPRLDDSSRSLYAERFGASSTIFAPLVVGGQWVGYINAIYRQPTSFPEPEVRRLMVLAGQAAVAVQNLRNISLLEERATQLEQLARLETALSRATTEEEILQALGRNLQPDRPDRLVLQYLTTDEADQPLYAETVAVWEEGQIREADPDLHQRYHIDQISLSKLWIEAPDELLLVPDVQSDPRLEEDLRELLTHLHVAAFANLPLRSGNRWQGLVALDWAEPRTFSDEEQALYRQLLEPVAAVVASRRAYIAQEAARNESERLARRELTIRQITEKMRAATTLEQLIQTAAEELGQRFSADYALVELGIDSEAGGGDNGNSASGESV